MRQDSVSQLFEANATRGADVQQGGLFSYVSVECRFAADFDPPPKGSCIEY